MPATEGQYIIGELGDIRIEVGEDFQGLKHEANSEVAGSPTDGTPYMGIWLLQMSDILQIALLLRERFKPAVNTGS